MDVKEATSEQRIGKEVKWNRKKKIIHLVAAILGAVFVLLFIVSAITHRNGNFTVNLNFSDRSVGLSLYDNRLFRSPTTRLSAETLKHGDNITAADLESVPELDEVDGSHNGRDYFAYTFYIRNAGDKKLDYAVSVNLLEKAKGAEEAIRVMVIEDSISWGAAGSVRVKTIYAKVKSDGSGEPEPGTVPFAGETVAYAATVKDFTPELVRKYTVVIFLEGNDPDCTDDILGGMVRLDMQFTVLDEK